MNITYPQSKIRIMAGINNLLSSLFGIGGSFEFEDDSPSVLIRHKHGILHIPKNSLFFVEKQFGGIYLYSDFGTYKITENLNRLERKLGSPFFRSHRTYLINMDRVKYIQSSDDKIYDVAFEGYDKIARMSRARYNDYKLINSNS